MRIVMAASEAVPFAKTGGLADVTTALSKALVANGHMVSLFLPHYEQIQARSAARDLIVESTGLSIEVRVGKKSVTGEILRTELPHQRGECAVQVFLVHLPFYFNRPGLYQEKGHDYADNCERFVFFSRIVMEACRALELCPEVIHAHDWQTALIPALLDAEYWKMPEFRQTAAVYTIHNLAFQGHFWHWDMLLTGLDWKYFNWEQMEFFGHLNLMKTGIVFADMVTTVSPNYAMEIQTPEFGCGLNGVLKGARDKLVGILNGVDTDVWNPATDPHIAQQYTVGTVSQGKPACKRDLQHRIGLPPRDDIPVFGMISRMTDQKGFDLFVPLFEQLLDMDAQFVVLGSGESRFEEFWKHLAERRPEKFATKIGFDDGLAHQIEAGADAFLMPSRFEPCGLNQMYSLMYGTVPLVRPVGGLADSVVDLTGETLRDGRANGFWVPEHHSQSLLEQLRRVTATFHDSGVWGKLVHNGMSRDWSWAGSAAQYEDVYRRAIERAANPG